MGLIVRTFVVLTSIFAVFSGTVESASPVLHSENTLALSGVRTGLQVQSTTGLRYSLWEEEGNVLRENTGVLGAASLVVSPAHARAGAQLTISPLAIFDLHLYAGGVSYFGNFQTVVGYSEASTAVGSNADIADWVEQSGNQSPGRGMVLGARGVAKLQVGPVVGLLSGEFSHWRVSSEVEGSWYFEREKEVLIQFGADEILDVNGLVLYQHEGRLFDTVRAGSFTTWRYGLGSQDSLVRSGALLSLGKGAFRHNVVVQAYLKSRNFSSAGLPYMAYALQFNR
jgi:hypothetical protein